MSESSASHRLNDVQDVQDLARRQEESKSPSVSVLLKLILKKKVCGGIQSSKIRIPGNGRSNSGFNVTVKTFPGTRHLNSTSSLDVNINLLCRIDSF